MKTNVSDNAQLIAVSHVNPVYNKHGRIVKWQVVATYRLSSGNLFNPYDISSSVFETWMKRTYTFRDWFGFGYDRAWNFRINCLGELDTIKRALRQNENTK